MKQFYSKEADKTNFALQGLLLENFTVLQIENSSPCRLNLIMKKGAPPDR